MSRYRALGWDLAVISPQGADLELDLRQPPEVWWQQLADLGLDGVQVNLGLRTGQPTQLLVIEVTKGPGLCLWTFWGIGVLSAWPNWVKAGNSTITTCPRSARRPHPFLWRRRF